MSINKHSLAHERSESAIIDPSYSADITVPDSGLLESRCPWLYGEAEFECWRLQKLIREMHETELIAKYPGAFHKPSTKAIFRIPIEYGTSINIKANGCITAMLNNEEIYSAEASEEIHTINIPDAEGFLRIELIAEDGELPALLIEEGELSTRSENWQWSMDSKEWSVPTSFAQNSKGIPPHHFEKPEKVLEPVEKVADVYDFGRELFGRILFAANEKPLMFTGESQAEALNEDPAVMEQKMALVSDGSGKWISRDPLAFRYVRFSGAEISDVRCRAQFHPAQYRGAFACSDEKLTRIWMSSAYTLRLCMHDFLIDGVKRDRLPWTGDLAMSMLANAYSFGDSEMVRRSLTVLGRAGIAATDINGIVDYSLWWIIAQDLYQRYFSNLSHLEKDWPRIKDTLCRIIERCDNDMILRPGEETWLFIDWVDTEKQTALQVLLWWALISGASLADRLGEERIGIEWVEQAGALADVLFDKSWDSGNETWMGNPDIPSGPSRHATLLAVIAGIIPFDAAGGIINTLLAEEAVKVGTPYMKGFESMAIAAMGHTQDCLVNIRDYWGAMLDLGGTTFWEGFDPALQGDAVYSFYNRPFANSLCHAWSAGPAAVLPIAIFGIRPFADGWLRFTISPDLADLEWACTAIPTPHGTIEIEADKETVKVVIPEGTVLEIEGEEYTGEVELDYLSL